MEDVKITAVSVPANGTATVHKAYTVPSGFRLVAAISARFDSSETTGATNYTFCTPYNFYTLNNEAYVQIRNNASAAALITAHILVLYRRA